MRVGLLSCVVAAGLSVAVSLLPAAAQAPRVAKSATAAAAGEGGKLQESNEWTVGVAGGLLEGTNIRFAAEMAKVLDDRPNLRVLPMVTYGALGNIEDLLYLRGVDVTITSADVLDEFVRNGTLANIKNRIRYICSFYINEMHVYVRPEIRTLEDLAGKKVSFNTVGSAANLTGGIVFDRLKINAEKVFINNSVALEKMRTGEIAGVVHVTGKPTDLFAKFKPEPGFRGHYASFDMKDHDEVTHINIDKMEDVHAQLVAMISQLSQTSATVEADPVQLRYLVPPKASVELWDSGVPVPVRPGETLDQIAANYRVPLWALQQSNRGLATMPIVPGQRIILPRHLLPQAANPPAPQMPETSARR